MKILRLLNFNMLFRLVLTKFFKSELFSCLPKVDHVIKSCKEPIITIAFFVTTLSYDNFSLLRLFPPLVLGVITSPSHSAGLPLS